MLGDISDEEANKLIALMSDSFRVNALSRSVVESRIFPVTHYISVACYILYDQSHQYDILKRVASKISPEDIAKRSKTLGSPLNHLAFYSIAMLYLHGRAQVINDNLYRKRSGEPDIVIEPEAKKKETKFILDFWRRLSPNYLNDGALTVDNKKLLVLTDDAINILKEQMIPVDNNKELIKKVKQTIAHLTIFNFLFQAECRAGISEHGPYYFEGSTEPLVFKEFQYLYSGNDLFGIDISSIMPYNITQTSPVPNVIFGMTLKNMNKIEFNDWCTLFADPADFSTNITSIGIWTKELMHPKDLCYPDNLGVLKPISLDVLDELVEFAKKATRELYVDFAKWSFTKKLMLGTGLYANYCPALFASYAGLENEWEWMWPFEYAAGDPLKTDRLDKEKIDFYIEKLKRWKGGHPFLKRMMRGKKLRKNDPFYYFLRD
jgi:hypothetical protein